MVRRACSAVITGIIPKADSAAAAAAASCGKMPYQLSCCSRVISKWRTNYQ